MGSTQVQSSSTTSAAMAAQQNSNVQAQIQNAQTSIATLQPAVAKATDAVSAASAKVTQDYGALAADPTNKKLQAQLTEDLTGLQAANSDLATYSKQLSDLIEAMPNLIAQAQAQDAAQSGSQKAAAKQDDDAKEAQAQATADAAKQTLSVAANALKAGERQFGLGTANVAASVKAMTDSYANGATASAPSSDEGLKDMVGAGDAKDASSAASPSGSAVNAGSILSHENIDGRSWLRQHADEIKKQIGQSTFDNLLGALDKQAGDAGGSASGAAGKATAKTAVQIGKGGARGGAGTLGASAPNGAIPNSFTSNTSASGGVDSSTGPGKLGFAQPDDAAKAQDPQASVNPSNMSANEILMLVMLEATDELNKEMQGMAAQLQKATNEKTTLRGQLEAINGQISYSTDLKGDAANINANYKAQASNVQTDLDTIGDDTQMMQMRLQNLMQNQQQFIQAVSNISKNLNDTSMAVLRHIGS